MQRPVECVCDMKNENEKMAGTRDERIMPMGEARRKLAAVEQRREAMMVRMKALMEEFRETFSEPTVTLVIHRQEPGANLRWRRRAPVASLQTFLTLTAESGSGYVQSLPPKARRKIFDFDRRAADLNLRYNTLAYERKRLKSYMAHVTALDELAQALESKSHATG